MRTGNINRRFETLRQCTSKLHDLPSEGYKELQINMHLFSLQLYRGGVTSIVSCDPQY
jgi:hypothetical protein